MIKFKKMHIDAIIPTRSDYRAAGFDLFGDKFELLPGNRILVNTGIAMAIEPGYVGIIKPRSGLALKNGIDVLGGVIDSNYRGEVKVILINHGGDSVRFDKGDRIAQLVVLPIVTEWQEVEELDDTDRGHKGFGSSGK